MPTNAAASPIITGPLSARLPTRIKAWSTMASTAAFRPKNRPATRPTLP